MIEFTLLDRAIAHVAPRWALERAKARANLALIQSRFDGAARGRRTKGWHTSSTSINADTLYDLDRLRERSRDLAQNNEWAQNGIRQIKNSAVGIGIRPQVHGGTKRRRHEVELRWAEWAETLACDAHGATNFYGLQALVAGNLAAAGEVLVRRRDRRLSDGLPAPLQLETIEVDQLDTTKDNRYERGVSRRVVQGVEFDALHQRTGYHLLLEHPGEASSYRALGESRFVPAADIAHVFRTDRPGQVRGVPWGAAAILRLRDFADYEDAELLRQKIAGCFAGFVTTDNLGGPASTTGVRDEHEDLQPGALKWLRPGEEVTFATPPQVTGLDAYASWQLRAIAAGYGVSYEALTGDLSRVNFSSARMGWLFMHAEMQALRHHILIPRLCTEVWKWFLDALRLERIVDTSGLWVSWTPPRREMIDPGKEVRAKLEEIDGGLTSWSEAVRERGFDPEDLLDEIKQERKERARSGVVFTRPGAATPPEADSSAPDSDKGD